MKKTQLFIFLLILFLFKTVGSDICTQRIASNLEDYCENQSINSTHSCSYSNGQCQLKYSTCTAYTGSDKTICESIFPSDSLKYCKLVGIKCTLFNKVCEDYDPEGKFNCDELSASDSQSCRLINQKCQAHYDKCEDFISEVNEEKCKANIPLNSKNKCIWVGGSNICKEVPKECKDYSSISYSNCASLLTSDENKICVTSSTGCEERYKTCELYDEKESSKNKDDCEAILIYSDTRKQFDSSKVCSFSGTTCFSKDKECEDIKEETECEKYTPSNYQMICIYDGNNCKKQYKHCATYNTQVTDKNKEDCEAIRFYRDFEGFDPSYKCIFKDGTCSLIKKECNEFDSKSTCESHKPEDYSKICVFSEGKCEEQFKTCEDYDKVTSKTKEGCEKIQPYNSQYSYEKDIHSRCVFSGGSCINQKKECSEMTLPYQCAEHVLDDTNKKCVYHGSSCIEVYKSCSAYNNVPDKSEEGCRAIDLYDTYSSQSYLDYEHKCVYEGNTCKQKYLSQCEDYESWMDEKYCKNIDLNSYQACSFKDNKCVTVYTECPGANKEVSEEICKSITPSLEYTKCVYDENQKCVSKRKECSEYTDETIIEFICSFYYTSSNENKTCALENGKCVEKLAYCEAYTGKEKTTCESIIPHNDFGSSVGSRYKCVFENNKCIQKARDCKEARSDLECKGIKPDNNYKECIYHNGECIEQYKDCKYYSENEKEVMKSVCESIILDDKTYKCIFDSSNKKCQKEKKICSDFNTKDFEEQLCMSLSSSFWYSKCSYTNSVCSQFNKTCFELEGDILPTEEVCSNAPTSDPKNKICKLKGAGSGCQEVDKSSSQSVNENNNDDNNGNNGNCGKSGKNKGEFISKFKFELLFIILLL